MKVICEFLYCKCNVNSAVTAPFIFLIIGLVLIFPCFQKQISTLYRYVIRCGSWLFHDVEMLTSTTFVALTEAHGRF